MTNFVSSISGRKVVYESTNDRSKDSPHKANSAERSNKGYSNTLYTYRLSHEGRGDISFIARGTISYFVTTERSERER